jgi:hypothetical protein
VTVLGLPLHPLIVHATVVAVPAAALSVLLAVLWPRFRAWFAWGPVALAVVALVLVPVTTSSGESLEHALPRDPLIEAHAHLADGLLPWVVALLVGAVGVCWPALPRVVTRLDALPRWLVVITTVIAVAAAVGALVEVVLIGHSGATAAWSGTTAS